MFSPVQIGVTALVSGILAAVFVFLLPRLSKAPALPLGEVLVIAVVVAVSVLFWRLSGNTATLNEDPIAFVSPNDVLCPVLTYVCLGVYAGIRGTASHPGWARIRAGLTLISLMVNVVTI